jgi:RimJ/RimL family protein N-acetyltransferase
VNIVERNILRGTFVDLIPLTIDDAELTFKWRNLERAQFLNKGSASIDQQCAWIAARPDSEINWIITLKQSGAKVGMLSLINININSRNAESARFLIGDEEAVKGIPVAAEAMKILYDFAFTHLNLHKVYGQIAAINESMIKWQKYLGMKEEGLLREHLMINDELQDAVIMGILSEEYLTSKKKFDVLIGLGAKNGSQ